ncbi:MAG: hypothetical protein H6667_23805 [Ardenticatenaceae bacterium]|nr:hypothetical protein [Ardenticatenaceae bacterium]
MAYQDHFRLADDMIIHLNTIIASVSDPFITSRYVGFVAVTAVTVYELAIKDVFFDFGNKKHKVLGTFTRSYFDRINGRIKIQIIRDEYVRRFGDKYVTRFKKKIEETEELNIRLHGRSIQSSYNNIIIWRNEFAHEGKIPGTVTYNEVTASYEVGKEVIKCLAETMYR